MTEQKPEKKVVSRTVAIALGTICILLIGFIAYFSITAISAQNSYNSLQNQNKQLQTWLAGNETLLNQTSVAALYSLNSSYNNYVLTHSHTNSDYNSLSTQNTNLQNQVNSLNNIVDLKDSTGWFNKENVSNAAGEVASWSPTSSVSYAGYIAVQVKSLTNNNSTFVEVVYSSSGFSCNIRETVGISATVGFPILPTTNLIVYIGTSNGSAARETVTIVYYY